MAYQTELSLFIEELERINFRKGYLTAQIEHHLRMLRVLDVISPKMTSPSGSTKRPGTNTGSATEFIWEFLGDNRATTINEIVTAAERAGLPLTKNSINAALSRLVESGYIERVGLGVYKRKDRSGESLSLKLSSTPYEDLDLPNDDKEP